MIEPLKNGNIAQVAIGLADSVSPDQFIRELLFNGIQAVQRQGTGEVVADYLDVDLVPKLRFWDTGDGMTRHDLVNRLGHFAAQDRTGVNFGVGAKVSLWNISPHGVEYISVRDGQAYQLQLRGDGADFGVHVFDTNASDPVDRHTRQVPLDDARIPEEIRGAGHGTVVIVHGKSADDATSHSLRGAGGENWLVTAANSRFARIPKGVTVRVAAGARTRRRVKGSAAYADYYVTTPEPGEPRNLTVHGAKGKVKLAATIPATAEWWVLPNKQLTKDKKEAGRDLPSHYRIGGKIRVLDGDECYLETNRMFRTAGIWTSQGRVELHITPGEAVKVAPDPGRSHLKIDGQDAHEVLDEWCQEFAKRMPKAIQDLLRNAERSGSNQDTFRANTAAFYDQLYSAAGLFRSNRGGVSARLNGQLGESNGPQPTSGKRTTLRRRDRLRGKVSQLRQRRGRGGSPTTGQTAVEDQDGPVKARRALTNSVAPPAVRWVNTCAENRSTEFGAYDAGGYEHSSNLLVLNAEFAGLRNLLHMRQEGVRQGGKIAAEDYVQEKIRDAYVRHMTSAIHGVVMLYENDADKIRSKLTDDTVTALGANLEQLNKEVSRVLGSKMGRS